MPMVASLSLSKKRKIRLVPEVTEGRDVARFRVACGGEAGKGFVSKSGATCVFCGQQLSKKEVREQAVLHGIDTVPVALVCGGGRKQLYIEAEYWRTCELPESTLDQVHSEISDDTRWFSPPLYGMTHFDDLFSSRQKVLLAAFAKEIGEVAGVVEEDARRNAGLGCDQRPLSEGGTGPLAYSQAISCYLACALSRLTDYACSLATWNPTNENIGHLFQRQAIPMVWDFAEANLFDGKVKLATAVGWIANSLLKLPGSVNPAEVQQADARSHSPASTKGVVVSTDPPYFDNIGYSDLSDFFYVWLRLCLRSIDPELFNTMLTPKADELVARTSKPGSTTADAETHFRSGFAEFCGNLRTHARRDIPVTIYYAFKQSESSEKSSGVGSTGWESMLEGLVNNGMRITGTWPVRTTKKARSIARGTNALASAIVIVGRFREDGSGVTTRSALMRDLKRELPPAIRILQDQHIAPVDLAQAAIGPGMAEVSKYDRVLEASGTPMAIRDALILINDVVDQTLEEQEGDFDEDTRWAIAWFSEYGTGEGPFGRADDLSRAKNTSVDGLQRAGIVHAQKGQVNLLRRDEMPGDWDPEEDSRLTVWEATQHLIRRLEDEGEAAAAGLLAKLGVVGGQARDLAYRLFNTCERKGWTEEARSYNGLVISWPDLTRLVGDAEASAPPKEVQQEML